jgi:diguanylate cyclase (GGDEF)-like protein
MAVVQRPGASDAAGAARVGGLLFIAASLIAAVLTVADPEYAHNDARVLAMSLFGVLIGTAYLILHRHAPRWLVFLMPPLGGLTLCFGMVLDRNIVIGGEVLLTWPLLAAYMMPGWVIACTVAVILAAFTPIALWILGPAGVTPSITMTVTLLITVLVLSTLRRRNARLLDALHRQAMTDGLTGLPNRRAFTEALASSSRPVSLALVDVDHFKRINDTAGHAAGDETLRALGELLARRVRGDDLAARIGGEEFVVLLPNTGRTEALAVAERLRASVEALDLTQFANGVRITVSAGVAGTNQAMTPDALLSAADEALYAAKRGGRNQVRGASS